MHRAEVGARRPHQAGDPLGGAVAVEGHACPPVEAYGLTASTSAPSLASTFGMTNDVGAVAVVDHQLEPAGRDGVDVDGALERGGVVLEGAGREVDVADLLGQHPAEVLAVEQALDLALGVLGDVDARRCRRSG